MESLSLDDELRMLENIECFVLLQVKYMEEHFDKGDLELTEFILDSCFNFELISSEDE